MKAVNFLGFQVVFCVLMPKCLPKIHIWCKCCQDKVRGVNAIVKSLQKI